MKTTRWKRWMVFVLTWAAAAGIAARCEAQQILLDKPVAAGELTLFPDLNDDSVYYYVPDKPRIATDANGRPQFSFLRYVENVRSGASDPEAREGEGGGILHALVTLSVSDEQLQDARRELQRVRPGARIEGPVVFRSGRFALISSFAEADGTLSKRVVGLGNAPLLDGEKAAVSIHLTKQGAKILWESFETSTPDVSFSFEMEVGGYRSPIRALIEADFDQIYEHQSFNVGVASTFLAAEIKGAFDDLQRKGAIKLTQVGENEKLEALVTTAYNKIAEMMFQPVSGTGTPSLASLTGAAGGQTSLLDRATNLLNTSRRDARAENERIRRENREAEERRRRSSSTTSTTTGSSRDAGGQTGGTSTTTGGDNGNGDQTEGPHVRGEDRENGVQGPADTETADAGRLSHEEASARENDAVDRQEEVTVPSFAVVAAFEIKRVRQRGIFKIDLNKHTADTLTLRFDENIGEVGTLRDDPVHFRQVNLDDPLYKQREVVAFVDGLNAQDFGQYINFVTVQMRKRHQGGDETHDEVRIDRNNFNSDGNAFKLLYGWKGDDDRRRWMEYDVRAVWSFFGGQSVEEAWQTNSAGALNLAPPFQRRAIELEADPDLIADAGVRAITVKVFYDLGGGEKVEQKTLNASKGELSDRIEFMLPGESFDYDYEIVWRLRGNRTVTSGRQNGSEAILFVDEVPGA